MAKIKINTLGLPEVGEVKYLQIGDTVIEIRTLLPYEEIFNMIQWSINFIMDDRPFVSAPLQKIIQDFAVIKFFTNLDVDEIEKVGFSAEQLYSLYDILKGTETIEKVRNLVNKEQLKFYEETLTETLKSLVEYRNSAAGLLERIHVLAENQNSDIASITEVLDNPKEMEQVKRMLELMGQSKAYKEASAQA